MCLLRNNIGAQKRIFNRFACFRIAFFKKNPVLHLANGCNGMYCMDM